MASAIFAYGENDQDNDNDKYNDKNNDKYKYNDDDNERVKDTLSFFSSSGGIYIFLLPGGREKRCRL